MTSKESIDQPWLQHPDGKWSPRPQQPFDRPVSYGIEEAFMPMELEVTELNEAQPEVRVSPVQPIRLSFDLLISLQNFILPDWSGVKTLADLHDLYAELGSGTLGAPPLCSFEEALHVPPALRSYHAKSLCADAEAWLLKVLARWPQHPAVQGFFSLGLNFGCDVLCLPLATHISEHLGDPVDLTNFFRLSSKSIADTSRQICAMQWERIFQEKWPVFYTALSYGPRRTGQEDWEVLYKQMITGKREEILEVFDREKKIGFSMSCMVAKVSWEQSINSYVANYVSASHVLPERIPADQHHRLRFCPPSAQGQLQPEITPPLATDIYPFRVLHGLDGVVVGQGVELQWKMQMGSPFGWWYGRVEHVERQGETGAVTLIFEHFPTNSRWYRLRVVVGDGVVRRCAIGGYHGGIRAVTPEESKVWMQFRPKEPITF